MKCLKCGCELDCSYPFRVCRGCSYLMCGITEKEKIDGLNMLKLKSEDKRR